MSESKINPITAEGGTTVDVPLLKDEKAALLYEFGVATVTFYKGDFQVSAEALRAQLGDVCEANPWLAGRLVKVKESGGVTLRHPAAVSADSSHVDTLFTAAGFADLAAAGIPTLAPNKPYAEMMTELYASKKLVVDNGLSLVGKDKPVTLLTLAESAPGEFAMVFSISHGIADGRTYYEVLQMLQPGAAVRALTVERVMSFPADQKKAFDEKAQSWQESFGAMTLFMGAMMCKKQAKCYAFHLDAAKVAAAKQAGAVGVDYVSTNDVLTSAFFNTCRARVAWMGFDCRDKGLEGIGSDLAGNYVTALVLGPEVFATPASMRQMYTPGQPYVTAKRKLPGCGCCCGNRRMAQATNWSGFTGSLVRPKGCEMVLHLPAMNPAYIYWDYLIPFVTGVDAEGGVKKGVMCWTVNSDEDALKAALPVGESVSAVLFPKA